MKLLGIAVIISLTLTACARHVVRPPEEVFKHRDSAWRVISEPGEPKASEIK